MIRLYYKKFFYVVSLIAACVLGFFQFISANDLKVDQQAPANLQPHIEIEEQSGVPIINITRPSPAGISHNIFKEYNVGEEGVIFNNNPDKGPDWSADNMSVLAQRPLFANENLYGEAAKIILTEVSGYNISNLLGLTEIYGKGADFILANPNGIYCNGAGFINAHRVTLTTGRPDIDIKGILNALNVDRGTIEIHSKGLSIPIAPGVDSPVEIISRAVKITGELARQDTIYVYAGKNKFHYQTRKVEAQPTIDTTPKPYLAIDGALVGKIGARKIIIIATEQGVGVNCPSLTADADNIEITADGTIRLKDIQSVGDLLVTSKTGNIQQQVQETKAQKSCKLEAKEGAIYLSTQRFQTNQSAEFTSKQLQIAPKTKLWVGTKTSQDIVLKLNVQEEINNQGAIYAPKIELNRVDGKILASFHNSGKLITHQDLKIEGQSIYNQGEIVAEDGKTSLIGQLSIHNKGTIRGASGLQLSTQNILENTGNLELVEEPTIYITSAQYQGSLVGKDTAKIQISNQNSVNASQVLELQGGQVVNVGRIYSHTSIKIKGANSISNQGKLKTPGLLKLLTGKIDNQGILLSERGKIKLVAQEEVVNKNLIAGEAQVVIGSKGKVTNQGQVVSNKGKLIINAKELTNTDRLYGYAGQRLCLQEIVNNEKTISTQGELTIETPQLINRGILSSREQLSIEADILDNLDEINSLGGNAELFIRQKFSNQTGAKVIANQKLILHPDKNRNQVGERSFGLTEGANIINEGLLQAENGFVIQARNLENAYVISTQSGNIKLNLAQQVANQTNARIISGSKLSLQSPIVENQGLIAVSDKLDIKIDELNNCGKIKSNRLVSSPFRNITNTGFLQIAEDASLIGGRLINDGGILVIEKGKLTLTVGEELLNKRNANFQPIEKLETGVQYETGTICAKGGQQITVGTLRNKGQITSSATIRINSSNQVLNKGSLHASRKLHVKSEGALDNLGSITAYRNVKVMAKNKATNIGKLVSKQDIYVGSESGSIENQGIIFGIANVQLQAQNDITQAGTLTSGQKLVITTDTNLENSGSIHPANALHIQANNIINKGTIESKSATMDLIATQKIYNHYHITSEKGNVALKAQAIENQQGAILGSDARLTIDALGVNNQREATVTTTKQLKLLNINELNNSGTIRAFKLKHTGTPFIKNLGALELHKNLTLATQSLVNSGDIILTGGDLQIISQANITVEAGKIVSQQGTLQLTSNTGNIVNLDGTLSSHKNLMLVAQGGHLNNSRHIESENDLHIQVQDFNNSGEIVAKKGVLKIKNLEGKFYNSNKIQSENQLEIEALECMNEGKLISTGKLDLKAKSLRNQHEGSIQAHEASITAEDYVYNFHEINSESGLSIQAGKLDNRDKIQANERLAISTTKGNLNNSGVISSEQGSGTITVTGKLKNDKEIKSYHNLNIHVGDHLENNSQIVAEQKLDLNAQSAENKGKMIGRAGTEVTIKRELFNKGLLGTGKDLFLKVGGQLKNAAGGQLFQAQGQLKVNSYSLHNAGDINVSPTNQDNNIQVSDFIYNVGDVKSRENLKFKASNYIENKGAILTQQNLELEAPNIKHLAGYIQSNQGDVILVAINRLENAAKLNACQGTLRLITSYLDNQVDIKLDKNLILNIRNLDNSRIISAKGIFQLLGLQTLINRSSGVLAGGEGESQIEVATQLDNHGHIFTKGGLSIKAPNVNVTNKGRLTVNDSLSLNAKNLINDQLLQGGENTTLTIAEKITNNHLISSIKDLTIHAEELGGASIGVTPTIQANRNITIKVGKLDGNDIKGGKGDTHLRIQGESLDNSHKISSEGNLFINAEHELANYNQIISGKNLTINAAHINNRSCVQGGEGVTLLKSKSNIVNSGSLSGSQYLSLESNIASVDAHIHNEGMLQAGKQLTIVTNQFINYPYANEVTVVSGGDMLIQANRLKNESSNIFVQGNLVIEGLNGGYAEQVSNITDNREARIEAMGDMTIRAKELGNKGKVLSTDYDTTSTYCGKCGKYAGSDWILVDSSAGKIDFTSDRDGWLGTEFEKTEKTLVSRIHTQPGYINTRGNLFLHVLEKINNNDSQIVARGKIQIGGRQYNSFLPKKLDDSQGPYLKNKTYSMAITISDAYIYNKEWIFDVWFYPTINYWKKYHRAKTFKLHAVEESIIRAGGDLAVDAKQLQNGISASSVNLAPCAEPLEKVAETQTISTFSLIELPRGNYGVFKLQQDPYASDASDKSAVSPQIKMSEINVLDFQASSLPDSATDLNGFMLESLVPQELEFAKIRQEAPIIEGMPVVKPAANTSGYVPTSSATDPGLPTYELPSDSDLSNQSLANLLGKNTTYKPAPEQEPIKFSFLPPLIRTNVPVDQAKFYGSPYFLRHVGLDPEGRGTPNVPSRFLGDPFFESRLINNAIYKQTSRPFLYDDVATPEEQVKRLIDNTVIATKDLKLSLGVSLSKDQINTLNKDILWYVEEEVAGQKVLVPQIYLTQNTINNLRSGKGTGIHSVGNMNLQVAGGITNTGNISSAGNQTIRAESLHNESFGSSQATITSRGITNVETKHNIGNISAKIGGKEGTRVVSQEGKIRNESKLLNNSTLHLQAAIESGGDLFIQAKGKIVNKAGAIKAVRNGVIRSEKGDVKNETQKLVRTHETHSSTNEGGFWNRTITNHTTTETITDQAVSSIEMGGNLEVEAQDITFMGTNVTVGGDAAMKASGDFKALSAEQVKETQILNSELSTEIGLFASSIDYKMNASHKKQVQHNLTKFNVGGKMNVEAGKDISMVGTDVKADTLLTRAQGLTDIREVYNTEYVTTNDVANTQESKFFGLYGKKQGHTTTTKSGSKKAAGGNQFRVNNLKVEGVQDVNLEKLQVIGKDGKSRAKNVDINSSKGKVRDHAGLEYSYAETKTKSHKQRHGLFISDKKEDNEQTIGTSKEAAESAAAQKIEEAKKAAAEAAKKKKEAKGQAKNKGRLFGGGVKLYEKQEEEVEIEEKDQIAVGSKFYTEDIVIKSEQKDVELIGTQIDASQDVLLSGKEGVSILAAKEESSKKEKYDKWEKEVSIGIKNKFLEIGQAGKEAWQAYNEVKVAKDAYATYRKQKPQVEAQYQAGNLSQEEYQEYKRLGAIHLAAVTSASIKLASKGKNILSTTSNALLNASTGGFSFDLQADIERSIDDMLAKEVSSKSANIQAKNIKIESENRNLNLVGSHLSASDTLTLDVKGVNARAFSNTSEQKDIQKGYGANAAVEMPINILSLATGNILGSPTGQLGLGGHIDTNNGTSESHSYASMLAKNIQLNVKENLELRGVNAHATESIEGKVEGKVLVETLQQKAKGETSKVDGKIGVSEGLDGLFGPNIGGGLSTGKEDMLWSEEQSSLTSSGKFNVIVGGETHNYGGKLGSESEQTKLETEAYVWKDLENHKKSSETGVNVGVNFNAKLKVEKVEDIKGGVDFRFNKERKQTKAALGKGNVVQGSVAAKSLVDANRELDKTEIKLFETGTSVSVDSDMVRMVSRPVKTAKEISDDSKIIYNTAEFTADAVSAAVKNGVVGTMEALHLGLVAGGATVELVKEENETQKLSKAQGADELNAALKGEGLKFQRRMGIKKPAKVELYQGDDVKLKDKEYAKHNASFDKERNTVNYNTSRKGFNKIETVADDLAHEGVHKYLSENKATSRHINEKQEEGIAQLVGKHARRMASSIKDKRNSPVMSGSEWNAKNTGSRVLEKNNSKLSGIDGKKVKASPGLLADRSPFSTNENNPLKEHQQLKEASKVRLAKLAAGEIPVEYYIPILGSLYAGADAIEQGNLKKAVKEFGIGLLESVPFPLVGAALQKGAHATAKGAKLLLRPGLQTGVAKGGEVCVTSLIKVTPKLTHHAVERMVVRGISKKMLQTSIDKGLKFYDPLNQSINYILPNAFSSGKSLLVSVNPLTGQVTTVIRSSKNLIRPRMISLK